MDMSPLGWLVHKARKRVDGWKQREMPPRRQRKASARPGKEASSNGEQAGDL